SDSAIAHNPPPLIPPSSDQSRERLVRREVLRHSSGRRGEGEADQYAEDSRVHVSSPSTSLPTSPRVGLLAGDQNRWTNPAHERQDDSQQCSRSPTSNQYRCELERCHAAGARSGGSSRAARQRAGSSPPLPPRPPPTYAVPARRKHPVRGNGPSPPAARRSPGLIPTSCPKRADPRASYRR